MLEGTDCVDPPVHHMMIKHEDSDGVKWEKVTTDRMYELVSEAMKKTIIDEKPPVNTLNEPPAIIVPQIDETEDRNPLDTNMADEESSSFRTPAHETYSDSSHKSFPQESLSKSSIDSQDSRTTFSNLLKNVSLSKASGVIFNSHWIMVTDCGGQPPFLDAAALFVQNSCLVLLPVKLNEPLSNHAEYSYFVNDVCESDTHAPHLQLTHLQTIEKLAKSIASFQLPQSPLETGASPRGIKFTVVGTFEDEAVNCTSETMDKKDSILRKALEDYQRFRVDYRDVITRINAVTTDETEREKSREKLQLLIDKSKVTIKKEVKLCWFGFLLSILDIVEKESVSKAVLTLDECFKLGDDLGMDKSQTREAIEFFDEIRLIMHFNTRKLRNVVIIDTQVVFIKLTELLRLSFLDESFVKQFNIKTSLYNLRRHGLFTRDELEKWVDFKSCQIEVQFFLDVLEHKKIISAIECSEYYFIPCALSSIPEDNLDKHIKQLCLPDPWVIKFSLNAVGPITDIDDIPIPVGYLPTLVIFLLKKDYFSIGLKEKHVQYRNVINIECQQKEGTVYLVERHMQLEVYYSQAKSHPNRFSAIKAFVLKSMQQTQERLRISDDAVTIFLCSCGKNTVCTYPDDLNAECSYPDDLNAECCVKGILSKLVTHHSCRLSSGNCMFTCHCMLICIHKRVKPC